MFEAAVVTGSPLLEFVTLSYVATPGTYCNASLPANASAAGWVRLAHLESVDPPGGGLRGLVFEEEPEQNKGASAPRVAVAFRGTDLGGAPSAEADRCADTFLAGTAPLPKACDKFPASTLDYAANARALVGRVVAARPGADVLLVGHSLGAALAAVAGVHHGIPSVGFATPSFALRNLNASAAPLHTDVSHPSDPVHAAAVALGKRVGEQCVLRGRAIGKEPPYACSTCYSQEKPEEWLDPSKEACHSCFQHTHLWAQYLDVLRSRGTACGGTPQGKRHWVETTVTLCVMAAVLLGASLLLRRFLQGRARASSLTSLLDAAVGLPYSPPLQVPPVEEDEQHEAQASAEAALLGPEGSIS